MLAEIEQKRRIGGFEGYLVQRVHDISDQVQLQILRSLMSLTDEQLALYYELEHFFHTSRRSWSKTLWAWLRAQP